MRIVGILGLGVVGVLFSHPAEALTISNADPDPHTVTVTVGGDSKQLTIEPEKEVEPPCDKGCTVQLENGEQYEMKGGEQVSIEDGVMFVDTVPGIEDEDFSGMPEPEEPVAAEPESSESAETPAGDAASPQP